MIKRYAFYGQAAKLHDFYNGTEVNNIKKLYPEIFNKLVDIAVSKGYHPDISEKDITGWIQLADPACADYDERYRAVQSTKKSKDWALVESMTLPGIMARIIEEAKKSNRRRLPYGQMSSWKGTFISPTSEWYHPMFAKDLYKVKPEWCEYILTDDEQKELLAYMIGKGNTPTGRDPWMVPKEHALAKFKGTLRPLASRAFKTFGKKGLIVSMIEQNLKNGIKPKEWGWFEYNYADDAKRLKEKYPDITNKQEWLKDNLTPVQQEKVDKWNRVAELVLNDVDDYELVKGMSKEERSIVGNHLKQLDQTFAFMSDKIRNTIEPIIEKIKHQRPVLYNIYCHTKLETTGNKLEYWMRDIENKQTQEKIFKQAKQGTDYIDLDTDLKRSMNCFMRSNTKYPEFKKEIEQMRPDWFDEKLRKKLIRERFNTKKKEMIQ
jgi:hypothetical protein